jgi:hypothetical protein
MKNITILTVLIAFIMIGCGGSDSSSAPSTSSDTGNAEVGIGGSMARFTISGDFLYTVNKRAIQAFDISEPSSPIIYERAFDVPFDVETLYSYKDRLYLGSKTGVTIYSKPDEKRDLEQIGQLLHVRSKDPVVIQDDVAYVTLRSIDGSGANELQILDVKDPTPKLIKTQRKYLVSPGGLGVDGKLLFICDGSEGLKIFDINHTKSLENNESNVSLTFNRGSSLPSIDCYDLIPHKDLLVVSNGEDVRQFDYSHLPMVEHNASR